MAKSLTVIVVIIIIIVIIGAVGAFYLLGDFSKEEDEGGGKEDGKKNILPDAFFTGNSSGRVQEKLWFDANGSSDEDGDIEDYMWDFGDSTNPVKLNTSTANHTYYQPGIYEINLTVIDDQGGKDSYIGEITIRPTDYTEEKVNILISRLGIDEINETIPIEEFANSLLINISVAGVSVEGNAVLDIIITNSVGIVIGNDTMETRGQASTAFYYTKSDLVNKGDYEMEIRCTQGSVYLNYIIEVEYA